MRMGAWQGEAGEQEERPGLGPEKQCWNNKQPHTKEQNYIPISHHTPKKSTRNALKTFRQDQRP